MSFQMILLLWVLPVFISFGFIAGICALFPRWIKHYPAWLPAMLMAMLGSWSVAIIGVPNGGGIIPLPTVLCIFITNIGDWQFAHGAQLFVVFGFACWWIERVREKLPKTNTGAHTKAST